MNLIDFGYEIEYSESVRMVRNSKTGELEENYVLSDFYLVRDFTDSELRLLIDSLLFSKHIPYSQCKELIDKIIEEASANGIILERPSDREPKNEKDISSEDIIQKEFIDGFNDAIDNGKDEIHENIDDFNNIINENSSEVSKEKYNQFIEGYRKADFSKYNSNASENGLEGSRIYFHCTLNRTEILEADETTSILGYVTDEYSNQWLIQLHFVPAVSETAFNEYIDKKLIIRGVYSGFSATKQLPVVILDEMLVVETGQSIAGMQKLLD